LKGAVLKKLLLALSMLAVVGFAAAQELTLWTYVDGAALEWLESEAAKFEAAFGVPISVARIDLGEIKQKMLLDAPEGEAADVVAPIPHDQIGEMATGGVLADMSFYATSDYLAGLSEQAKLAFTYNGQLVGLPMYVEGPALIVNTDLVSDVPATFEEMVIAAQDLTTDDTFGFLYDISNFYFSYVWMNAKGGYVFERGDDGSLISDALGLNNEGAIAGAKLMKDLRYTYELIPPSTDYSVADTLFRDGSLGMIYNGPWAIPNYKDAGIKVQVLPIPAAADGTQFSGFMGVQGVLLNQFSDNKVNAANFAKWISRSDAQVSLAEQTGNIPASQSASQQMADDPVITGFSAALQNAVPMPNIPEMGSIWGPMGDALTIILESADSDPAAELTRAVEKINGN